MNLTREQMEAGPQLDALVAKEMGWTHRLGRCWIAPGTNNGHFNPPAYSTDIAAAWQVVEAMNKREAEGQLNPAWFNFWHNRAHELATMPAREAARCLCWVALVALLPAPTLEEVFTDLAKLDHPLAADPSNTECPTN